MQNQNNVFVSPGKVGVSGALPAQYEHHWLLLLEHGGKARAGRGEAHRELQIILLLQEPL